MNAPLTASPPQIKVIITGATGMVGEGVLLECLDHPLIEQVLMVNRRPYLRQHPKLRELIVADFLDIDRFSSQLSGFDACFFCAGKSSSGMSEAEYTRVTYDVTLHFAQVLAGLNPQMVFIYVSGMFTDSSEKSGMMWARVKGRTENALFKLPFREVYAFRPGFIKAFPGQKNIKSYYRAIGSFYPLFSRVFPNAGSTLRDIALAMLNAVLKGYPKHVLEVPDIKTLAKA